MAGHTARFHNEPHPFCCTPVSIGCSSIDLMMASTPPAAVITPRLRTARPREVPCNAGWHVQHHTHAVCVAQRGSGHAPSTAKLSRTPVAFWCTAASRGCRAMARSTMGMAPAEAIAWRSSGLCAARFHMAQHEFRCTNASCGCSLMARIMSAMPSQCRMVVLFSAGVSTCASRSEGGGQPREQARRMVSLWWHTRLREERSIDARERGWQPSHGTHAARRG